MMYETDSALELGQVYASVCANRHENIISCSKTYLLYSRSHSLVIHDLANSKQLPTLFAGHTDEVNGQCFIDDQSPSESGDGISNYVISTAYDKSAILWEFNGIQRNGQLEYRILHTIKSPNNEMFTTRCASRKLDGQFLSVTSTIDGSIQLWHNAILVQTIATKCCYFHSKLHTIRAKASEDFTFVLLAGSDNKIHLYQLDNSSSSPTLKHLFDLAGHSDWVKHLDIVELVGRPQEFLLASASQDGFIRVWHLKLVDYNIDATQIRTTVSGNLSSSNDQTSSRLTATLETVLSGHEGIVHGLCWFKKQPESVIQLISCSADKTIVVWRSTIAQNKKPGEHEQLNRYEQCPASAEIWKEAHRLGETGETNLPFLGACLSDDETTLYAHSLRGAIHSWYWETDKWLPKPLITGHFGPVTDLAWEKNGAYLLSVSLDKTCRLHAIASSDNEWHEITRPQVHGHEINCLVSLSFGKFATGAEEKTIRFFEATQFFMKNFKSLSREASSCIQNYSIPEELPLHAQLPALGLSNRGAMSPYDLGDGDQEADNKNSSSANWYKISPLVEQLAKVEHLESLPIEEILLQSTLWWETNKLFGHGNELHALATDSMGTFMASASKANRPDLASILVWECSKFRKVASIEHHSLTITRLRFSPDDRYLLSVSRDRTWCLSERTGQLRSAYKKLIGTSKANAFHERIIWDCCWTHDSRYFMTVSRDKSAILWSVEKLLEKRSPEMTADCLVAAVAHRKFDCSVQAVDCPGRQIVALDPNVYLLAFGLENGNLELHLVSETQWQPLKSFERLHHLPIRRLTFKPSDGKPNEDTEVLEFILASGGDDCVVKLTSCKFLLPLDRHIST